ncbi:DUF4465 domain-containing protein [Paludisphaera borealis]|uniref:Ice-binding protein C-terminal domain-containing protein n=1 Tax=Paludisphaera borealis TaxID=1387353 RepID=A0A1U7CQV4_9BACT|nr:DUF4465 domain-containing protein [Paludisphaera borealis]APW61312.1 hypothetical protein BSF38_02826 [Paludisphaera borealis]
MRFANVPALALILATASAAAHADVVTTTTFESVSIPAAGYVSNAPPGFTIDGNFFNNSYNATWGTWSGWAISNQTAPTPAEIASKPNYAFQYSASPGKGADGSSNYAVAFGGSYINVSPGQSVYSMDVTNTTYDYLSMSKGDQFSKKFGAGDFFTLSIVGHDELNGAGATTGQIDFQLADFLGSNHYIVNTWDTVDLTSLGSARSLTFSLSSSDNGVWGMNTPAYFALDNFRTFVASAAVPEPASLAMAAVGFAAVAVLARRGRKRTAG